MTKEMEFFVFLLENYAGYKKIGADEIMNILDELDLTEYIFDMYERYHSEAIENAYKDIDELIEERSKK